MSEALEYHDAGRHRTRFRTVGDDDHPVTVGLVRRSWKGVGLVVLLAAQWFGVRAEVDTLRAAVAAQAKSLEAMAVELKALGAAVHALDVRVAVLQRDEDRRGGK